MKNPKIYSPQPAYATDLGQKHTIHKYKNAKANYANSSLISCITLESVMQKIC